MPAAKTPQKKKPGPKPAKEKKPSAKELEQAKELARQALHRARMLRAYLLGVLTLVVLALALIPGEGAWLTAHEGLWGLAGVTLLPWLAIALYVCSLWLRNRSLKDAWLTLLCQGLFLLFLGAAVFTMTREAGELAGGDWWTLVLAAVEGEIPRNGGFLSVMLGAGLAMAAGKAATAIITLLLSLAALPMALPPLQRAIFSRAAGRWGEEPPPLPEKPEREKPEKPEKPAREEPLDELEELDRIGREHGLRNPFKRRQVEIPLEAPGRIPTVADIGPLSPVDDDAAGGIAENLAPGASKRKKAQQAGEEASRAAMEALLKDAAQADAQKGPEDYQAPPLSCLTPHRTADAQPIRGEEERVAYELQKILGNFGVSVDVKGYSRGPAVTRYELKPAEGVKISKITSLSDDIALHLAATKVRIEAPIPGKPAVGVEVPNRVRAIVSKIGRASCRERV